MRKLLAAAFLLYIVDFIEQLQFVVCTIYYKQVHTSKMKIAVVGCSHGELDLIYELINSIESRRSIKIDLVLINGDFQAVRNEQDMSSMSTPAKYAEMKTFWKYYSGRSKAPVLTLLVGGNHECSNYMSELPYGGWLAPNIYYLGYANVLNFRGLRIAGLSGIYHSSDYMRGHHEHPPFDRNSMRSVYHVRNLEIFRLMQLRDSRPFDIILSHDWPQGIYRCGDQSELLRKKPFLSNDIYSGKLGNPYTAELLQALKPRYWFSAHHHCKFAAKIQHDNEHFTNFLALDKCCPRREFMQIIDIDPINESLFGDGLCLDPEWLCVLRSTDHLMSTSAGNVYMPGPTRHERFNFKPSRQELQSVLEDFGGLLHVPSAENTFVQTAPVKLKCSKYTPYYAYRNPQTLLICQMLDIRDPIEVIYRQSNHRLVDPEELEDGEIFDDEEVTETSTNDCKASPTTNTTTSTSSASVVDKPEHHDEVMISAASSKSVVDGSQSIDSEEKSSTAVNGFARNVERPYNFRRGRRQRNFKSSPYNRNDRHRNSLRPEFHHHLQQQQQLPRQPQGKFPNNFSGVRTNV
ncbi:hypothetical protein GJ496_003772 [Pomphorhynchus laevis]|nr:hypothetical protein GJ496_003772 [Pomphorhynchus laevis]